MNCRLGSLLVGKKSYPRCGGLTLSLLATDKDVLLGKRQMRFGAPTTAKLTNLSTYVDDVGFGDTDVIPACTSLHLGDTDALFW
jgi:hypothetical protein